MIPQTNPPIWGDKTAMVTTEQEHTAQVAPLHVMILTGEPSGDFHAAPLIRSLNALIPGVRITGIGGPAMAGQGAELFFPIERLSAMGVIQVLRQFSTIKQVFKIVQHRLNTDRPDAVVLIDYPGFNLKIAQYIKQHIDIPVCYYIAPKVWAWNAARIKKIKAFTDHVALILPFEAAIYKKKGIDATYVGNPLVDEYPTPPILPRAQSGAPTHGKPLIGLLPGSRTSEIKNLLPVMLDAALNISQQVEDVCFHVSSGIAVNDDLIRQMVTEHPVHHACKIIPGRPGHIFQDADLVIAASGTVTLEAALCEVPTLIIYKLSALAWALGRVLIKAKYAGLPNLIMDQEVMPELLQDNANSGLVSHTVLQMLEALPPYRFQLAKVRQQLGTPGAPERTAKIILNLIRKKSG